MHVYRQELEESLEKRKSVKAEPLKVVLYVLLLLHHLLP